MSAEEKARVIDELSRRIAPLREQRNIIEYDANVLAERRDTLNERVRNLRREIQELHSKRDTVNENVKILKQQRNDMLVKVQEKIDEIRKLISRSRVLAGKKPSRGRIDLKEEVESIDWYIQTTPLTTKEDREMVEKVRLLETQLNIYRKLEKTSQKINSIRTEVDTLKAESNSFHDALTREAQRSQEIHEKMLAKIEESKKTRSEADEVHRQFVELREKAKPFQKEIEGISNEIAQLKSDLRAGQERERKQSEEILRQSLENRAKEKLRRGEKLTWEEFQLLAEKGFAAQA